MVTNRQQPTNRGRPRISVTEKAGFVLNIRVTKFERGYIRDIAGWYGLPVAALLRQRVFERPLPCPTPPLNLETFHQLSRVKSNLTQIKKAVLLGEIFPFDLTPLERLANQTDALRQALRHPSSRQRFPQPSPPNHGPRNHRVRLRTTPAEAEALRDRARRQAVSVSAYVRDRVLGHRPPRWIPSISRSKYRSLYQLQWRLNTIAHAINGKRLRSFDRQIFVLFERLYRSIFRELNIITQELP